ncbi:MULTISPECIES: TetR/AcrR family transcriptional regulator [Nonomuraea]|uniref:TetR/AcrR family transcriptional regulator C-terminal ligand-binding domain-containing protein n=1 Tax=Nonomuraea mangrovi TaxID=2316207 RepID=A0ABW4STG5_9ACTN
MQRPGGRSARVRSAVHQAVVELLREGVDVSVAEVAERSGVHQATIYRRWGTIAGLVNDVVIEVLQQSPVPDTGTLRGDLDAYAVQMARDLAGPFGKLFLRAALVGSENADDQIYLLERGVQIQGMLDRHENAPTLIELMEIVQAPIYFHALVFNAPLGPEQAKALVDRLLSLRRP